MKKKALVIGSHTSESLSPLIFNYWFHKYKINASYFYKEITPNNFQEEILEILADENIVGFNVTIPFKETIKNNINGLDQHASKIGAVNCVSKINNKWLGRNTDWTGSLKAIESIKKNKKIETALILGFGGASKAIFYALKKIEIKKIYVFNRTSSKLDGLDKTKGVEVIDLVNIDEKLKNIDIVINTTPTNILKGLVEKKQHAFAFDVVYSPKETNFLSYFKDEKKIYGISMLVHQAIPCFEEWFGIKPVPDEELYIRLEKKI